VTTATGVPSGTVEFYDSTIDLGPGTLAVTGGSDVATLVAPPLALGDHGYSAVYSGDGTFNQSNSSVVIVSAASALGRWRLPARGPPRPARRTP